MNPIREKKMEEWELEANIIWMYNGLFSNNECYEVLKWSMQSVTAVLTHLHIHSTPPSQQLLVLH